MQMAITFLLNKTTFFNTKVQKKLKICFGDEIKNFGMEKEAWRKRNVSGKTSLDIPTQIPLNSRAGRNQSMSRSTINELCKDDPGKSNEIFLFHSNLICQNYRKNNPFWLFLKF